MTTGYSGTPLPKKLGITEGHRLAVVNDPGHFLSLVAPLPASVQVRSSLRGKADVIVLFTLSATELRRRVGAAGRAIHPDGALWVAWPKKASRVTTDMTEDVVRQVVLPMGMVDVKVAAVDETWSGLKIVWRKEYR